MRKSFTLFIVALSFSMTAGAQSYTDHVQQKRSGMGTVTITQSQAIDDLVNGKTAETSRQKTTDDTAHKSQSAPSSHNSQSVHNPQSSHKSQTELASGKRDSVRRTDEEVAERRREAAEKRAEAEREADNEMSIPTIDMRKKVMRGSRKVRGYRVQAFAGGNSRADRQRAQQIGNAIKMKFPDQPVYVHFYSPRWICRVGNFRSYEQANRMLKAVRAMGYKGATIVQGKITVQD